MRPQAIPAFSIRGYPACRRVFLNPLEAGPVLDPYRPPQEEAAKAKQQMSDDLPEWGATIVIFWPTLLCMMVFFLYTSVVQICFHGDMGLGIPGFLPCFIICAWVLSVVGLLQLVFVIVVLYTKNSRGALHLLSALAVFLMTFGFYQYFMAGNIVTVQNHQVPRSQAADLA